MSESAGRAVFLSYASQDAEAARRICEALRAVGVEVWFDQNELVGGDAWDAKIRGQISSCALFVPVISTSTQARGEGYFRLEWKLAVDRSHLMAHDQPFLLPVVIDATKDSEARVPPEFRAVQWTRLPGGETPDKFCERVKKLLGGAELEAGRLRPAQRDEGVASPAKRAPSRPWLVSAIIGAAVIAALASWQPWKKSGALPAEAKPAAPLSEARRLEQQARALIDDDPLRVRENYRTACELCERVTTLSPDNADAWATYARASCVLFTDYNERGDKAIAAARLRAERAIRLAPDSLEANLAKAQYAIQVGGDGVTGERQLRTLLERAPNDRRILRALTRAASESVDRQPEKLAESRQWAERAEALPGGDTLALTELGWGYWGLNRFQELDALLDRILTRQPTSDAYHLKVMVLAAWGDMDGVLSWLEKIPPAVLSEDRVASVAIQAYLSKRQPDKALALLARLPREFLEEGRYFSPKSYLAGLALAMAGKPRAAEIEFRSALKTVEDRIATKPNDARLFTWKGRILAHLGDQAGAAREFETGRELSSNPSSKIAPADLVLLGRYDQAIAGIEATLQRDRSRWPSLFSQLKFSQDYDLLRNDARFAALIARGDAWLREMRSPPATSSGAAVVATAADEKSVAVLAFANLSDDKDNEYFSDGISEELLNVLAKVPGLRVVARTSAFYFKGKNVPIPEIAQKLNVAYVVEGSVRKSGSTVRITAQLISAADGFPVWSDTFTRDPKNIFAVQDEIAGLISQNLQLKLALTARRAEVDPEAYRLLLQGRYFTQRENSEGWKQAIDCFRQALAKVPDYALAWAEMARCYSLLVRYNGMPFTEGFQLARAAAERALALDPELPQGHAALGWVQRTVDWNWNGAEKSFRRALALAPQNAEIIGDTAVVVFNRGRLDEAIELGRRAVDLDSLNASAHFVLSVILRSGPGHYDEAERSIKKAILLAPQAVEYHASISRLQAYAGHFAEAAANADLEPIESYRLYATATLEFLRNDRVAGQAALDTLIAKYSDRSAFYIARVYGSAGQSDQAFAWIERAERQGDSGLAWVKLDITFQPLRGDPRWAALLKRMNLADEPSR